jgi:putative membrane protein
MKISNKKIMKICSIVLVMAVLVSAVGIACYAAGAGSTKNDKGENAVTLSSTATGTTNDSTTAGKEETVYVLAGADGSAKQIIVSEWLKNPNGDSTISDYTELEDVKNVRGDETYTLDTNNMHIWDAEGNDIYYQGTTDKSLPVDVSISYTLDGTPVSAENLAGKSGKVTMRFDYTNNQKETVNVDGEDMTVYVPFVMVTGMILDNDIFRNVEVSNGKIINDGDRCVVMGFALPGMQESLGLDEDEIEIPSYVEITADVTGFELTTTLTMATGDMFSTLNLDDMDIDLGDSMSQLDNGAKQLLDGTSALYDGLTTLLEKSGELVSGVDALYSGAGELKDGAATLKTGASSLNSGIAELDSGLKTITANNDSLTGGAKTVFNSLLKTANTQLAAAGLEVPELTIDNYKTVLTSAISSIDENAIYNKALSQVTDAVYAQEAAIRSQVEEAVKQQVLAGVLQSAGVNMTAEQYAQAVTAGQIPAETKAKIDAAVTAQMESDTIKATIDSTVEAKIQEIINQNMESDTVKAQIAQGNAQAGAGVTAIQSLIEQLDSYNEFYKGVIAYTQGVSSASEGAGKLKSGAGQLVSGAGSLSDGATALYDGIGTLKDGSSALIDGVTELQEGSMELNEGMQKFYDEGIDKLISAFDGDLEGLTTNLKAIVKASEAYQSYAGIADDTTGSVKFIYKTDSIEVGE